MAAPARTEEAPPPAVCVCVCDGAPLLWRMRDLQTVRAAGLVGALLGSLARAPRQNGQLGRPLLLLGEEEALLGEGGAAASPPAANQGRGAELVQQHEEQQRRSYEQQSVLALQDRKAALQRAVMSSHTGPGSEGGTRLQELERTFVFPRGAMAVQLSTARAGLSYCPEARAYLPADRPIRAEQEPGPLARYQVFRDLRGRGFFLTSAGKFGGDFLVYPGDPLRFHAHFIAVCVDQDRPVALLDLLAVARLGSNVKKTVLLCSPGSPGPPGAPVRYTSLQWSGLV